MTVFKAFTCGSGTVLCGCKGVLQADKYLKGMKRLQVKNISSTTASIVTLLTIGRFQLVDSPIRSTVASDRAFSTANKQSGEKAGHKETNSTHKSPPQMSEKLQQTKEGSVWGMLIADAIAMPVHWYYNPSDIKHGYGGWLTGFVAPNKKHPSSILTLSAVDGSGRTGWHQKSKPVVGNVILHDKLKYWTSGDRSIHYHQGMEAGDNTLNAITALQFLTTMKRVDPENTQPLRSVQGAVLADYMKLMTTPGSHNDTYAESFHRSFFKDWSAENSPPKEAEELLEFVENRYKRKCKGAGDSQLAVIGSFSLAIPWIIHSAHKTESQCAKEAVEFIKCTHPTSALIPYVDMYARLLHAVLNGHDLKQEVMKALGHSELGGPSKRNMVLHMLDKAQSLPKGSEERLRVHQNAVSSLGMSCYIEGAMSSMLYLALEFADDFTAGVLGNANCGGENCHRGAALGALLGAAAVNKGQTIPQKLKDGLHSAKPALLKLLEKR